MHTFQRKSNGTIWRAGNTVYGLCAAYNCATNPAVYLSEHEMARSWQYARAIKNRMKRLGIAHNVHYKEFSNGSLWPVAVIAK